MFSKITADLNNGTHQEEPLPSYTARNTFITIFDEFRKFILILNLNISIDD